MWLAVGQILALLSYLDNAVKRVAPEIVEILDATDHAADKKPFYRRPG